MFEVMQAPRGDVAGGCLKFVVLLVVLLFGAVIVSLNVKHHRERQPGGGEKSLLAEAIDSERPPPSSPPITETCLQVASKFDDSSKLSELQKTELWKSYEGREFVWSIAMVDVDEAPFGAGYISHWKCQGSRAFLSDILISSGPGWRANLLAMKKGELWEIHGRFKRTSSLFGLSAEMLNPIK
jgi:hypothetical protein